MAIDESEDGVICSQALERDGDHIKLAEDPHIDTERSTTCVVLIYDAPEESHTCGEPVVGERGGFPMCEFHADLFGPEN